MEEERKRKEAEAKRKAEDEHKQKRDEAKLKSEQERKRKVAEAKRKVNERTPVIQNEDWWACLIDWFILLIAIIGVHEVTAGKWAVSILPAAPKLGKWTELAAAFPKSFGATIGTGLAWICISMDGATADMYNKIRIGSDFDCVCENVAHIADGREQEVTCYGLRAKKA